MLNVLVIGNGGREHALCWAISKSSQVGKVYCAPGNAGIADVATLVDIPATDIDQLVEFARRERIDLTVVGPEAPLVAGIVDRFDEAKLRVYGPSKAAARLEGSKAFAKEFMRRHHIPTGPFAVFDDFDEARRFIHDSEGQLVVKADGIAAGKGVMVCNDPSEAEEAARQMMRERAFGQAGERIVIERKLAGEEVSLMGFCDGHRVVPMIPARDYKPVFDGDRGPNTGGMGAYAPARLPEEFDIDEVCESVLQTAVDGMAAEGTPYVGVLYAGLMLTDAGPRVLEFNCRLGDPETQVVLPLLGTDLIDVIGASLAGQLDLEPVKWRDAYCTCVILASAGYPAAPQTGKPISGPLKTDSGDVFRFHAGTMREGGKTVTAGGRVLGVCARASSHESAVANAYTEVERISFDGMHYRTDIGVRQGQVARPRQRRQTPDRRSKKSRYR